LNRNVKEGKERYRPSKGYGEGQRRIGRYRAPRNKTNEVVWIGRECYLGRVMRKGRKLRGVMLMHVNSDHWKSEYHQRLAMPADQPGAVTLYDPADPLEHSTFAAHLTAERQLETEKGIVWERVDRNNHFLDAGYLSTAAAYHLWLEWLDQQQQPPSANKEAALIHAAGMAASQPTEATPVHSPKRRKAEVQF
jgi:phage terminase large subunit GpA-like protein